MLAIKTGLLFSDERGRKAIAWILAAALSPLILITAVLCSLASGGAEHNNTTVKACFYGPNYTEKVPSKFKTHVSEMREAFSLLDSAIAAANSSEDSTGSLDPTMVKAVFFALCFGEDAPTVRAAGRFVDCFYSEQELTREVESEDENGETVTETETYTAITPLSLSDAYTNLSAELGREIISIEIFWDDLTETKQREIMSALGDNGNYDVIPIAVIHCKDTSYGVRLRIADHISATLHRVPKRMFSVAH